MVVPAEKTIKKPSTCPSADAYRDTAAWACLWPGEVGEVAVGHDLTFAS
jgi:hypothetical protein